MKRNLFYVAWASTLLTPFASLLAQIPEQPAPLQQEKAYLPLVIAVGLFAIVATGAFKPSKRGHQD